VTPVQYKFWNTRNTSKIREKASKVPDDITYPDFDFVQKKSRKLVVTIGESWTWGDSLGKTFHEPRGTKDHHLWVDDKEYRLKNTYGGQLADTLKADFLNVAECGRSNIWIAQQLQIFLKNLHTFDHDEIFIAVTLTEVGRDFPGGWPGKILRDKLADVLSMHDFLHVLSTLVSEEIQKSLDMINNVTNKKIKIFLGTNFVESNYPDLKIFNKSWVQLIAEKLNMKINTPCYVVNSWVYGDFSKITDYTKHIDREKYLKEMKNIFNTAEKRIDFLNESKYNVSMGSKHPTEEGHKIWKECILEEWK